MSTISSKLAQRRYTPREFQDLAEAGILTKSDRVELFRGEIEEMSPIGSRHNACVNRLSRFLHKHLEEQYIISVQGSIQLLGHSQPQPDIVVLTDREDYYESQLPQVGDVRLVIEVAESSLDYDRQEKQQLYAEAGIEEFWLVELIHDQFEIYTQPRTTGYHRQQILQAGEVYQPEWFAGLKLTRQIIFGKG